MSGTPSIGSGMDAILGTPFGLYGMNYDKKAYVYQYQNKPGDWLDTNIPFARALQLSSNQETLFAKSAEGHVFQYDSNLNTWTVIGENVRAIAGGGVNLYGINAVTGNAIMYLGQPKGWTDLGAPVSSIVSNSPTGVVCISANSTDVMLYRQYPKQWQKIGSNFTELFWNSFGVFAISDDGQTLLKYSDSPNEWTPIGQGWTQLTTFEERLYALSKDGRKLAFYSGTPGDWVIVMSFDPPLESLTAGNKYLYDLVIGYVNQLDPNSINEEVT
jgi:hypothetical protein